MKNTIIIDDEKMEEIIASSYVDFHARGLDYICLHRSHIYTDKLYFFDNKISEASEVVNPHNHKYSFLTVVLDGAVRNKRYYDAQSVRAAFATSKRNPDDAMKSQARIYQEFDYMTPLNSSDGGGFYWRQEKALYCQEGRQYRPGDEWFAQADDIHTLKIERQGTILRLIQTEDLPFQDAPTRAYTLSAEPPELTGLYSKPTPDQVIARLKQVNFNVKIV